MLKMAFSLLLLLQPVLEWAQKQNNFIDDLFNCNVKNQMLAIAMLTRGLNGK